MALVWRKLKRLRKKLMNTFCKLWEKESLWSCKALDQESLLKTIPSQEFLLSGWNSIDKYFVSSATFKNQLLRTKMKTFEFESVYFIIIWKTIQSTSASLKLRTLAFLKAFFLKDTKCQNLAQLQLIIGQTWTLELKLTFILEFIDYTTVIILLENSLNSIKSNWIHQRHQLKTISCTQEWCSIWSRFLLISLKRRNILRLNSKEESQIKNLTGT